MRKISLLLAGVTVALALTAGAQAHVTIHPNAIPSGGFTTFDVRVPNERPKARTMKVDVQFPSGYLFLSYQAMPGWSTKVIYRQLAKPVVVFGETHKQEVDRVVWTARSGGLPARQFIEFPLSIAMPNAKAGSLLTFKALQRYSNGEIVRWIGPPSADTPAPQVYIEDSKAAIRDYPGGVGAARKDRAARHTFGLLLAAPLLGLAFLGLRYRRRHQS